MTYKFNKDPKCKLLPNKLMKRETKNFCHVQDICHERDKATLGMTYADKQQ